MVRKLIQERLAELGITRKELSIAIDCDAGYISQFLVRGVPAVLLEPERIKIAEILKISPDALRGPSAVLPKRRYEKKSTPTRESLIDPMLPQTPHLSEREPKKIMPGAELFGPRSDLPVFGTAQGGSGGALIVSDSAVDWVARPAVLLRVEDGYGMIVTGDSMSPEHKEGSIALVNPHLPPRIGDSCIFRSHADDGTNMALIKEYRGQTEHAWKVRQHNPPKDFTLKKSDWQIVHRAVGNYFP